jgi:hypothetical protein
VILHLKEDAAELADPIRLQRLIKQYSQFIQFPIKLWNSRKEPQQVVDEEATKKAQEEEDKKAAEASTEAKKVGVGGLCACGMDFQWQGAEGRYLVGVCKHGPAAAAQEQLSVVQVLVQHN